MQPKVLWKLFLISAVFGLVSIAQNPAFAKLAAESTPDSQVDPNSIPASFPDSLSEASLSSIEVANQTGAQPGNLGEDLAQSMLSSEAAQSSSLTNSSLSAAARAAVGSPSAAPSTAPSAADSIAIPSPTNTHTSSLEHSSLSSTSMGQVTSVDQLSDVQPTDWAYQALQSLVERYGCIAGYPDGTYRGNRALTRYEFAAGVNACLDRITELLANTTADLATKEDLATLQRLREEFSAELTTLRGRVESLETRTAELEAHQFSTTTTMNGSMATTIATIFGRDDRVESNQAVLQSTVQFNFDTSFSGRDRLRARLEWGNYSSFNAPTGSRPSDLGVAFPSQDFYVYSDTSNTVALSRLEYTFPIGDRATVFLEGKGAFIRFNRSYYASVA